MHDVDVLASDVRLTTNLFGDVLFNLTSRLAGGSGSVPGMDIGRAHAMAQATHGSASDIAGRERAGGPAR